MNFREDSECLEKAPTHQQGLLSPCWKHLVLLSHIRIYEDPMLLYSEDMELCTLRECSLTALIYTAYYASSYRQCSVAP